MSEADKTTLVIKRLHSALGEAIKHLEAGAAKHVHLLVVYEDSPPEPYVFDTPEALLTAMQALPVQTRRLWAYVYAGERWPITISPDFAIQTTAGPLVIRKGDTQPIAGQDGALFSTPGPLPVIIPPATSATLESGGEPGGYPLSPLSEQEGFDDEQEDE